jgi:DNA-binding response OmpR family regulator
MVRSPCNHVCDFCQDGTDPQFAISRPCRERVRALIIDHDREDAESLAGVAARSKQLCFYVTIRPSLPAAEAELMTGGFDIIFLEYWLGSQTAIAFLLAVASRCGPPCVVVTDLDEPDIRRVVFRAGAEAFLSKKSLGPQALESVTMAVLRARALATV